MFSGFNLISMLVMLYKSGGRDMVKRFITIPQAQIKDACAKSGTDYSHALKERNDWVESTLQFVESLADKMEFPEDHIDN